MPSLGFNPFMMSSQKPKVPYPAPPPFNPSRLPGGMAPPPGMPPPQPGGMPPPEWGPHEGPHAPPPPPDPSLIPQMPQASMGPPSDMGGPPRRLGLPGDTGPKLSAPPPGSGMADPFANLSDAQKQELGRLGNMPEEIGGMDEQIARAEALRFGTPEGRDSGRVYTAANPMEHIGSLMKSYGAKRQLEGGPERLGGLIKPVEGGGLYGQRKTLLDNAGKTRADYFNIIQALRGGQ